MRILRERFERLFEELHDLRPSLGSLTFGDLRGASLGLNSALCRAEAALGVPGGEAPGPASIAGEAEKRSALPGDGTAAMVQLASQSAELARQAHDAATRALEKLSAHAAKLRSRHEGLTGVVELQRRRVETCESVMRIARTALQDVHDEFGHFTYESTGQLSAMERAFEALQELGAALPEEKKPEPSPVDQSTTPLNPELMVECRGVATYTTLRAFLDANPDDAWVRAKVLALKPGDSATLEGGDRPSLRITRKVA